MSSIKVNGRLEENVLYPIGLRVYQAFSPDNIPRLFSNGPNLEAKAFHDNNRIKYEAKFTQRPDLFEKPIGGTLTIEPKRERITIAPQTKDYYVEVLIEKGIETVTQYSNKGEKLDQIWKVKGLNEIIRIIQEYIPEIIEED